MSMFRVETCFKDEEFYIPLIIVFLLYWWIFASRDGENVHVKSILKKWGLYNSSVYFMFFSKDNKGLKQKDNINPDTIKGKSTATKTIIFIRHGESDWNNVFNKGINLSFPFRLVAAIIEEFKLFLSATDSKFLDSPLNHEGIEQALELRRFISSSNHPECSERGKKIISVLRGDDTTETSIIVTSTLRRAIATTTLALWPRIVAKGEKILLLSSLQEISRNIDTQALAGPHEIADLPFHRIEGHCPSPPSNSPSCKNSSNSSKNSRSNNNSISNSTFDPRNIYDLRFNSGNKSMHNRGILRLKAFNEWAFSQNEDIIIVGGHSLWFKSYFQVYLPFDTDHDAKTKKITNSGVVSLTVEVAPSISKDGTPINHYRIEPTSIECLYGGFTTK